MFNFEYSYLTLPDKFHSLTKPSSFPNAEILLSNNKLNKEFNLPNDRKDKLIDILLLSLIHI